MAFLIKFAFLPFRLMTGHYPEESLESTSNEIPKNCSAIIYKRLMEKDT